MIFIDNTSRKVLAYAIKHKDEVLDIFSHFNTKVERKTRKSLKCIRIDNGGEYRGPFEKYCSDHGIQWEKIESDTPQYNGVAERINRTICEKIRCMLSHARLSKSF